MASVYFAIECCEEHTVLSSKMERAAWSAIESLARCLNHDLSLAAKDQMFTWRAQNYLANARDPYAWRRLIDQIKDEIDLSAALARCQDRGEESVLNLAKSKPIMLKISGEIANALIHSYQNRHAISFRQLD